MHLTEGLQRIKVSSEWIINGLLRTTVNFRRSLFTSLLLALLAGLPVVGSTYAATYYVAPNGSDSNSGSASYPWATFAQAMRILRPGDTLILKDGTYYQSLDVTISGTQGSPITFKAQNDGKAIVDGQGSRAPFEIYASATNRIHDITVEGIRFQNAVRSVVYVVYVDRLTMRRVSAYNANIPNNTSCNCHQYWIVYSSDSVFEDCAASGSGSTAWTLSRCNNITLRRCWGRWIRSVDQIASPNLVQVYGSSNCLVENCIFSKDSTQSGTANIGIAVWANRDQNASNNRVYGNVVHDLPYFGYSVTAAKDPISGNRFINNVAIDCKGGFLQRADSDLEISNFTVKGASTHNYLIQEQNEGAFKESGYLVRGTLKNSILYSSSGYGIYLDASPLVAAPTHKYNDLYSVSKNYAGVSADPTEKYVNPGFDVATYGRGAYLMRPSNVKTSGEGGAYMGAEVLYRYRDGVLTNQPLWPWPMEGRIKNETGVSVTWESGGGLWKTLDGVYTGTCIDNDGDGYGNPASTACTYSALDCNDSDPSINPGAEEDCFNGIDDDCNGQTDCADSECPTACPGKSYTINRISSPPVIDGNINELANVPSITITNSDNTSGTYKLAYDSTSLYIAAQVADTQLNSSITTEDDGSLYAEDSLEIMFDTLDNDGPTQQVDDYKFFVNLQNTHGDSRGGDMTWDGVFYSSVVYAGTLNDNSDTDSGYTIEVQIPWSTLGYSSPPPADTLWGLEIVLDDRRASGKTQTPWANTNGGFINEPDGWGTGVFASTARKPIPPQNLRILAP